MTPCIELNKNTPLVSIIMPAFNAEKYIANAIESIINQTYQNWELLICDDASIDNTKEIIERYTRLDNRIITSHNVENQKLLKTRNRLLGLAKGEYITFQDADDFSHKNRIELLIEVFKKDLNIGLLSSQVGFINNKGELIRISKKPTTYDVCLNEMYKKNVLGGSMMMIKTEAFKSVGLKFREYFDGLSNQDFDLAFLIAENYKSFNVPEVLYYYRQHSESTSKQPSVDRLIAEQIVRHLAYQRKSGLDDVEKNNQKALNKFFETKREIFNNDKTLVFRIYASNYMYNKMYRSALILMTEAFKKEPYKLENYKTFRYCLYKSFISLFR